MAGPRLGLGSGLGLALALTVALALALTLSLTLRAYKAGPRYDRVVVSVEQQQGDVNQRQPAEV